VANFFPDGIEEMHIPRVKKEWTFGNILSALVSIASLAAILIGGVFFLARLDNSTKDIPNLVKNQQMLADKQNDQATSIAVLQDQQRYTDLRYAEIMNQLSLISAKIDKQAEQQNADRRQK